MKHTNEYLYAQDEVPEIPADIIMRRLELLRDNLADLLNHTYYDRDQPRVAAVLKAIKFWESIR